MPSRRTTSGDPNVGGFEFRSSSKKQMRKEMARLKKEARHLGQKVAFESKRRK